MEIGFLVLVAGLFATIFVLDSRGALLPNWMLTDRFPRIGLVRKSLALLIPKMARGELPPPATRPWLGYRSYNALEPVLSVQAMARDIAAVYKLSVGVIVVVFVDKLEGAGQVELGDSNDFFVEIRSQYERSPAVIAAILGHEVAHIFLHKRGIRFEDTLANEVLTDTTAAAYGFGVVMADTYKVTQKSEPIAGGVRVTTTTQPMLGYLTPEELGFALTRFAFPWARGQMGDAARKALRTGRTVAERDASAAPLDRARISSRLAYRTEQIWGRWVRRWRGLSRLRSYGLEVDQVSFRCPQCCQGMRLPQRRRLKAVCPNCDIQLDCAT